MPTTTRNLPRPGHAGGHLRDAYAYLIREGEMDPDDPTHNGQTLTPDRLTGLLWTCTDTMPSDLCRDLELPSGSTYAQGVRRVRADRVLSVPARPAQGGSVR